jgi:hypothetical protein
VQIIARVLSIEGIENRLISAKRDLISQAEWVGLGWPGHTIVENGDA